ncbi:MAG: hypothetical protein ACLPP9_00480 [Smithella sp.]
MKVFRGVIFCVIIFIGCAHSQSPEQGSPEQIAMQKYAEKISQIQPPASEKDRQRKCSYLRSEIARQQNLAMMARERFDVVHATIAQAMARDNIALLESKASDFGCAAAFGNRPEKSKIESCIDACKENTNKTSEQCFDACNH